MLGTNVRVAAAFGLLLGKGQDLLGLGREPFERVHILMMHCQVARGQSGVLTEVTLPVACPTAGIGTVRTVRPPLAFVVIPWGRRRARRLCEQGHDERLPHGKEKIRTQRIMAP